MSLHELAEWTDLCSGRTEWSEALDPKDVLGLVHIGPDLLSHQQQQLTDLLASFCSCFSTSSKAQQTPVAKHRTIVDETTKPTHQHLYRISYKEQEAIRSQASEMQQDEHSKRMWASPLLLVQKNDKTLRFRVDYKKLNSRTKQDV